jgi:hypothetical protein
MTNELKRKLPIKQSSNETNVLWSVIFEDQWDDYAEENDFAWYMVTSLVVQLILHTLLGKPISGQDIFSMEQVLGYAPVYLDTVQRDT